MMQSTAFPGAGDDEHVRPVPDQREAAVPTREGVARAFLDSLAQFDELYRQLAR